MNAKPVGKRKAKAAAEAVYRAYRAAGGGLPVDVEEILNNRGVVVVKEPADSDLSGMLLIEDDLALVVVNTDHAEVRQRFSLAHECGHLELHATGRDWFHRDEWSRAGVDRVEIEANTFAAELLMPEVAVREQVADLPVDMVSDDGNRNIEKLARIFRVSTQAMSFRLQNLGIMKLDDYW